MDAASKHALLTYAYDKALTQVGERCDKKTIETSHKKKGIQGDKNTAGTSSNDTTESKTEEIEYGVRVITKIFETYCQNITAK